MGVGDGESVSVCTCEKRGCERRKVCGRKRARGKQAVNSDKENGKQQNTNADTETAKASGEQRIAMHARPVVA